MASAIRRHSIMPDATLRPFRDLTGKKYGWWYVVAYAGELNGVHLWRCMCRGDLLEKIVPEREIRNKRINALYLQCRCQLPRGNLVGCICGQWTVFGQTSNANPQGLERMGLFWKCRCACGNEREISSEEITSRRTLSCGCRTDDEVRMELRPRRVAAATGLYSAWLRASLDRMRRVHDEWTSEMEDALLAFQPVCVICGVGGDLTKDHVRPISDAHGLKPGNVVRLCRACNSSKGDNELNELGPEIATTIETTASSFKDYWDGL